LDRPQKIVVGTRNIQNILANEIYLQNVLKQCDILCIQEHWIFTNGNRISNKINKDYEANAKSVDDNNPLHEYKSIRGCGGVATFWRKIKANSIRITQDGNHNISVITISSKPKPVCIVNVYMPSSGKNKHSEYKESLGQLTEILTQYSDYNIIMAGDMNASLHRDNRYRDKLFRK